MKTRRIINIAVLVVGLGAIAIPNGAAADVTFAAMATPHTTWARGSDVPDVPVAPGPQGL
jgi:hypothetical protein